MKTLKKERRAFWNIGKNAYIPDCKICANILVHFQVGFQKFG